MYMRYLGLGVGHTASTRLETPSFYEADNTLGEADEDSDIEMETEDDGELGEDDVVSDEDSSHSVLNESDDDEDSDDDDEPFDAL